VPETEYFWGDVSTDALHSRFYKFKDTKPITYGDKSWAHLTPARRKELWDVHGGRPGHESWKALYPDDMSLGKGIPVDTVRRSQFINQGYTEQVSNAGHQRPKSEWTEEQQQLELEASAPRAEPLPWHRTDYNNGEKLQGAIEWMREKVQNDNDFRVDLRAKDVMKGLVTRLPLGFGIPEFMEASNSSNIIDRIYEDKATGADYFKFASDIVLEEMKDKDPTMTKALRGASQMPAFLADMYVTGGIATGMKAFGRKGLAMMAKKLGKEKFKSLMANMAFKAAKTVLPKVAEAGVFPVVQFGETAANAIPQRNIELDQDQMTGKIKGFKQTDKEHLANSLLRSVTDKMIEYGVEKWTGETLVGGFRGAKNLMRPASKGGASVPHNQAWGNADDLWLAKVKDDTFYKLSPSGKQSAIGFNGMLGEIGEERVTEVLQAANIAVFGKLPGAREGGNERAWDTMGMTGAAIDLAGHTTGAAPLSDRDLVNRVDDLKTGAATEFVAFGGLKAASVGNVGGQARAWASGEDYKAPPRSPDAKWYQGDNPTVAEYHPDKDPVLATRVSPGMNKKVQKLLENDATSRRDFEAVKLPDGTSLLDHYPRQAQREGYLKDIDRLNAEDATAEQNRVDAQARLDAKRGDELQATTDLAAQAWEQEQRGRKQAELEETFAPIPIEEEAPVEQEAPPVEEDVDDTRSAAMEALQAEEAEQRERRTPEEQAIFEAESAVRLREGILEKHPSPKAEEKLAAAKDELSKLQEAQRVQESPIQLTEDSPSSIPALHHRGVYTWGDFENHAPTQGYEALELAEIMGIQPPAAVEVAPVEAQQEAPLPEPAVQETQQPAPVAEHHPDVPKPEIAEREAENIPDHVIDIEQDKKDTVTALGFSRVDLMLRFPGMNIEEYGDGEYRVNLPNGPIRIIGQEGIYTSDSQLETQYNDRLGMQNYRIDPMGGPKLSFEQVFPTLESFIKDHREGPGNRGQIETPTDAERENEATFNVLATIRIANSDFHRANTDQLETLQHELVHYAHIGGLWSKPEWDVLVKKYAPDPEEGPKLTVRQQSEAIAMKGQEWGEPGLMQKFTDLINKTLHHVTKGKVKLKPESVKNLFFTSGFYQRTSGGVFSENVLAKRDAPMAMAEGDVKLTGDHKTAYDLGQGDPNGTRMSINLRIAKLSGKEYEDSYKKGQEAWHERNREYTKRREVEKRHDAELEPHLDVLDEHFTGQKRRWITGWFRNGDKGFKKRIISEVTDNPEVQEAAHRVLHHNYNTLNTKDIPFDEFMDTELTLYRGEPAPSKSKSRELDTFVPYSTQRSVAEKWTGPDGRVMELRVKPKDTYGSLLNTGESEVLVKPETTQFPFAMAEYLDPESKEFGDWHKDSFDKKPVFHSTPEQFDEFDVSMTEGSLGIHVGSREQAIDRWSWLQQDFFGDLPANERPAGNLKSLYIQLKKPLFLTDHGDWNGKNTILEINEKLGTNLKWDNEAWESESSDAEIRDVIKSKGYDGVVYTNNFEAVTEGSMMSYILFSPDQIRPSGAKGDTVLASAESDASPRLPRDLRFASPRHNTTQLDFARDLDKALYIIAKSGVRSKRDADYLAFVQEAFPDKTEAELRAMGMDVRAVIKDLVRTSVTDEVRIPSQAKAQATAQPKPKAKTVPKVKPSEPVKPEEDATQPDTPHRTPRQQRGDAFGEPRGRAANPYNKDDNPKEWQEYEDTLTEVQDAHDKYQHARSVQNILDELAKKRKSSQGDDVFLDDMNDRFAKDPLYAPSVWELEWLRQIMNEWRLGGTLEQAHRVVMDVNRMYADGRSNNALSLGWNPSRDAMLEKSAPRRRLKILEMVIDKKTKSVEEDEFRKKGLVGRAADTITKKRREEREAAELEAKNDFHLENRGEEVGTEDIGGPWTQGTKPAKDAKKPKKTDPKKGDKKTPEYPGPQPDQTGTRKPRRLKDRVYAPKDSLVWKMSDKARRAYIAEKARLERMRELIEGAGYTWDHKGLKALAMDAEAFEKILPELHPDEISLTAMYTEYHKGAMLSGPSTGLINFISPLAWSTYRQGLESPTAAALNSLYATVMGAAGKEVDITEIEGLMIRDYKGTFRKNLKGLVVGGAIGTVYGFNAGMNLILKDWKYKDYTMQGRHGEDTKRDWKARKAIPWWLGGNVVRAIGYGPIAITDQIMSSIITHSILAPYAQRIARHEGLEEGSKEFAQRVHELILDRSSIAWQAAMGEATEQLFQGEGAEGSMRAGFFNVVDEAKEIPLLGPILDNTILPFHKAMINLPAEGLVRIPGLGQIPMTVRMYQNFRANKPLFEGAVNAEHLAGQILFSILATVMAYMIDGDEEETLITGSLLDFDPEERMWRYTEGTVPKSSVRIGDFWWSIDKADPFASPISLWADIRTDYERRGKIDRKLAGLFIKSLGSQVSGKTVGQGVRDAGRAVSEGAWDTWLVNFTASNWPNLFQQVTRLGQEDVGDNEANYPDDWFKELGERVKQRTEIIDAEPIIDTWGRKAKNITGVLGIKVASAKMHHGDRIYSNWNDANLDDKKVPPNPEKEYTVNGAKRRFPNKEFSEFKLVSGALNDKLVKQVISDEHAKDPDVLTMKQTKHLIDNSRKLVKKHYQDNGNFDINEKALIHKIRIASKKYVLEPKPKPVQGKDPQQNLEEEVAAWEEMRAAQTRYRESLRKIRQ